MSSTWNIKDITAFCEECNAAIKKADNDIKTGDLLGRKVTGYNLKTSDPICVFSACFFMLEDCIKFYKDTPIEKSLSKYKRILTEYKETHEKILAIYKDFESHLNTKIDARKMGMGAAPVSAKHILSYQQWKGGISRTPSPLLKKRHGFPNILPNNPQALEVWILNAALLADAFREYPEDKDLLNLLLLNYLVKNTNPTEKAHSTDFKFQRHPLPPSTYKREDTHSSLIEILTNWDEQLLLKKKSLRFYLDTSEIDAFIRLKFSHLRISAMDQWPAEQNRPCFKAGDIILDLSNELTHLLKGDDPEACISEIKRCCIEFKKKIQSSRSPDQEEPEFNHVIVAALVPLENGVTVLIAFPAISAEILGEPSYGSSVDFCQYSLKNWLLSCALSINPLRLQSKIAEATSFGCGLVDYEYAGHGKSDTIYFQSPTALLRTNTFKNFDSCLTRLTGGGQLIGTALTKLITTLLEAIESQNKEEQTKPSVRPRLLQEYLFRVQQLLAHAHLYRDDFMRFSQLLDIIYADLQSILTVCHPFDASQFSELYCQETQSIVPKSLHSCMMGGLSKSAMGAITAAAAFSSPNDTTIVESTGIYYEIADFFPKTLIDNLQYQKKQDDREHHILYIGSFYPGFRGQKSFQKQDLAQDIERILKKSSDPLTVIIDNTQDYCFSEDVNKILEKFQKPILDGRLNVIICHSGVKFHLLGNDDYFGAPYLMINNRAEQWAGYQAMLQHPSVVTDALSQQYFVWLLKAEGLKIVDEYKKQTFSLVDQIMKQIPKKLFDWEHTKSFVPEMKEGVHMPFIILVFLEDFKFKKGYAADFAARFVKKMAQYGIKAQERDSFGFRTPTYNFIGEEFIRFSPGVDERCIQPFVEFFTEVAEMVAKQ